MGCLRRVLAALLLATLPLLAVAQQAIPALSSRVTDLTGTLSSEQRQSLEQRLRGLEQRSTAQVAILLVASTAPEDTFSYGMRVVEQWKLGQKGKDNGVLVLLAIKDRKSQILVGYGLEGQIPDVMAKRILDDVARPWFRQGDFAGGLHAIVSQLAVAIEGAVMEASVPAGEPPRAPASELTEAESRALLLMLGLFALGQLLRFVSGPLIAAGVTGGIAVPAVAVLAGSLGTGLAWGAALFFVVLIFRFSLLWLFLQASGGGRGGGSSWGGGGFSGGGGGFGGGGSSGSW